MILSCFPPFIDEQTTIMVIGTMPGIASLQAQEYYGHRQNLFWRIIAEIFNQGHTFTNYEQKLLCLQQHHIGLWDNLSHCERQGSLDSAIKNASPNNFEKLLKQYPKIKRLVFNGQQSYKFFHQFHPYLLNQIEGIVVPSTSPANASIKYATKLKLWHQALNN